MTEEEVKTEEEPTVEEEPKVEEQPEEQPEEQEEEVSEAEEAAQKLPFPTATVTRQIRRYITGSKMIKKDVKIGMNKFLGEVVKEVATRMDQNPYAMVDYRMLKDAVEPYKKVKQLKRDKEKIVTKLDAIIKDCQILKEELEEKFGEDKRLL